MTNDDWVIWHLTKKEFAMNGVTRNYVKSRPPPCPDCDKNCLSKIILSGGEKLLSPEQQSDQAVYFTIGNKLQK